MSNLGKELVRLVALLQPFCTREWGDAFASPTGLCNAILGSSADEKCYQTRKTCPVPTVFNPGTLTLLFGREGSVRATRDYGFVIPSIMQVSVSAAQINISGMDEEASALGTREQVTVVLKDHPYSDLFVDKYRTQRNTGLAASGSPPRVFDPAKRGTFWGKWLARNPYHQGMTLLVYEGFEGDALADMRCRRYVLDRIEGPADGVVKLVAKDIFTLLDDKKAVVPAVSSGRLATAVSAIVQSPSETFSLLPSGIGNIEYPAAGYGTIGAEVVRFTRSGDTISLQERGAQGTTAKAHDADDLFQLCTQFPPGKAHDHIWTMICNNTALGTAGSPTSSAYINKSTWDAAASSIINLYSAFIAKPTPVKKLIGELCEQAGLTVAPNVTTGMIDLIPLRAGVVKPVVNDADWIKREPVISLRRQDDKRVSQISVYFGQIDPTKDIEDENNFHSNYTLVDGDAEGSAQYGSKVIRTIYSRWIPQGGRSSAAEAAERIRAMFRDPPIEAQFALEAERDGELSLGRYFYLQTADLQDATGAQEATAMACTQLAYDRSEIGVKAQSVVFSAAANTLSRSIYIDNDCQNISLREIHDSLFEQTTGGSPTVTINFYVSQGVVVGSRTTSLPACRTGQWANGVSLALQNSGRIQGKGGRGGSAAQAGSSTLDAMPPGIGGDALLAEYPITVDNIHGQIWSGGGGGDAGQTRSDGALPADWAHSYIAGGGPGGAGAGSDEGEDGLPGSSTVTSAPGSTAATVAIAASDTAGGTAGVGANGGAEVPIVGGNGGNGGGPGLPGSNGTNGTGGTIGGAISSGALAGYAVNGISLVTWIGSPNGDRGDCRGRFV